MSAPRHVIEACAELAWEKYEEASQRVASIRPGTQLDIEETAFAERSEWRGIALACDEALA